MILKTECISGLKWINPFADSEDDMERHIDEFQNNL